VLLVEDSEDDAAFVSAALRDLASRVQIERVDNARDLEKALDRQEWDLVVSDYFMPRFHGLEALRMVRARRGDQPFILVSGAVGEKAAVDAMRQGADDYVMKGSLARLVPAVCRELRDARMRREKRDAEMALDRVLHHDPVTGLPNLASFDAHVARMIEDVRGGARGFAVIAVEVEHFQAIEQSLGRAAANALIAQVAARLRAAAGAPAAVARIDSGHFGIALPASDGDADAAAAADRLLRRVFEGPFDLRATEFRCTGRAGIARHPDDGSNPARLVSNAKAATHFARDARQRCATYHERMSAQRADSLVLESDLRRAIQRQEFVLHYQPRIDAASGRVVALEALIRWDDPVRGLVMPERFISLLETTGLITEVGEWVLSQAVRDRRRWSRDGYRVPPVAINVSAIQLEREDFVSRLREAIRQDGEASAIELEITESVLIGDVAASIEKLTALRSCGFRIAMDDFGAGYSSLGLVTRLPIQSLKIDGSFVRALVGDPGAEALVRAIVSMAHSLGLRVVAEGVELDEQRAIVIALGCDEIQGYLTGRPASAEAIRTVLSRE
jgi:diguanylate cyclase (GGDEF)-like protein